MSSLKALSVNRLSGGLERTTCATAPSRSSLIVALGHQLSPLIAAAVRAISSVSPSAGTHGSFSGSSS